MDSFIHSINRDNILLTLWVINDSTTANVLSLSRTVTGAVGTERGNTESLPSGAYVRGRKILEYILAIE